MTEWRVVPSFPCYEVSESGDVRRCKPGIRGGEVGKVMKPYVREDGYRMYILRHGVLLREVGAQFGVSQTHVSRIVRMVRWSHA